MSDSAERLEDRSLLTGTVQLSASTYLISEGAGNSTAVTVTRSGDTTGTASVDVALANGTAIGGGQDYDLSVITVNFIANQTSQTVTIPIINDRRVEGNETFTATLQNADVGTSIAGVTAATITIDDNDLAVVDAQANQSVLEGGAPTVGVTVTIVATGGGTIGLDTGFTVDLSDAGGGTATSGGTDYTFTSPTAINVTSGNFTSNTYFTGVTFTDDQRVETNETINFSIGTLSTTLDGQVSLGDTTHTLTISEDDLASVAITAPGTTTVTEGVGVAQLVNVTLTITPTGTVGPTQLDVTVSANLPGNADYSSTAAVFNAGAISGATDDIDVLAVNDQNVETSTESFATQLLQVSSTATTVSATTDQDIDVIDDDTATVTISGGTTTATEGSTGTNLLVTLTLATTGAFGTPQLDVPVTADLPGNADYTTTAAVFGIGSVHNATANIVVTAVNDLNVEGTESFVGEGLTSSSTATESPSGSRTVTITDNDSAVISFTAATSNPGEAVGTHNVQVHLQITSNGTSGASQLDYAVTVVVEEAAGGTATGTGTDYTAGSSANRTATFGVGSMTGNVSTPMLLTVVDDLFVESDETINLALGTLTDGTGGAVTIDTGADTHTVTIDENDFATVAISTGSPLMISENGAAANVVVTLTITSSGAGTEQLEVPITVNLPTTDPDYTPTAATFAAGAGSVDGAMVNISVDDVDDRRVEGTETKLAQTLTITSTAGIPVVETTAGIDVQITDNDTATIGFQTPLTVAVGEAVGTVNATAVLTISATGSGTIGLGYAASVQVTTTSGAATDGTDYVDGTVPQSTITFAAGDYDPGPGTASTSALLTVTDDQRVETNLENLTLGFGAITFGGATNPVSIDGGANSKTVNIDDNDFATVTVAAGTTTVTEGMAGVNLPVTLTLNTTGSGAAGLDVTVTADLPANVDYTTVSTVFATTGTQNISVTAVNDNYVEASTETFAAQVLVITSTNTDSIASGSRNIAVVDDDTATLTIPGAAINKTEVTPAVATSVTVTLTLNVSGGGSGPTELASGVTLTATLLGNADYLATTATFTGGVGVTTGAMQSFDVTAVDDLLVEQTVQTFAAQVLQVASPEGVVVNNTGSGTPDVTVTDNDSANVSIVGGITTVLEGASQNLQVTLNLTTSGSGGTPQLEVPVTADLNNTSGGDYTTTAASFLAGDGNGMTRNIIVTATDDVLVEATTELFNTQALTITTTATNSPVVSGSENVRVTDNDSASISITGGPALALAEAGGTQNLTVTLTLTTIGGPGTPMLAVNLSGDLDVSGTADVVVNSTADFMSGALNGATASIVVQAVDDQRVESAIEAVAALNLVAATTATVSPAVSGSQAFNVTDNDSAQLSIVGGTTTVTETTPTVSQNLAVTIQLATFGSGGEFLDVDVTANLPGNADYSSTGATFLGGSGIADGNTANIVVSAIDDRRVEGTESFAGQGLTNNTSTATISMVSGTETIQVNDNDTATIALQSPSSMGAENTTPRNVTGVLTISAIGTGTVQLDQIVSVVVTDAGGGTAAGAGTDYTAAAGAPATITFGAGSLNLATASTSALLTINNDTLIEANETVNVEILPANLMDGTGGQVTINLAADTHQATITDNDVAVVSIVGGTTSVTEGGVTQNVVVTLDLTANGVANTGTLTVDITADLPGNLDYSTTAALFAGAAMLADGATANIVVSATNDLLIEATSESFSGQALSAVSTATNASATGSATIDVTDNDTAQVSITGGTTSVTEGFGGTNLTVTLNLMANGAPGGTLTVPVTADLPGNADYTTLAAVFNPFAFDGDTADIVVFAVDDLLVEATQTFVGQALLFSSDATPTSGSGATGSEAIEVTDNESATIGFLVTTSNVDEGPATQTLEVTAILIITSSGDPGLEAL